MCHALRVTCRMSLSPTTLEPPDSNSVPSTQSAQQAAAPDLDLDPSVMSYKDPKLQILRLILRCTFCHQNVGNFLTHYLILMSFKILNLLNDTDTNYFVREKKKHQNSNCLGVIYD